ncbi:hypothetical protein FRC02_007927 [Tulasnella sp. 418]|nr:hypothetical protein FRC02_007927 [Tulasnella sp. 418]
MSSSSSDPDISLDETDVSGNEPSLAVRDPNSADRQLWTTFGPTSSNPLDPLHSRKPPRAAANRAILQDDPYAKGRITVTATPAVTIVQGQVDVGDDNSGQLWRGLAVILYSHSSHSFRSLLDATQECRCWLLQ